MKLWPNKAQSHSALCFGVRYKVLKGTVIIIIVLSTCIVIVLTCIFLTFYRFRSTKSSSSCHTEFIQSKALQIFDFIVCSVDEVDYCNIRLSLRSSCLVRESIPVSLSFIHTHRRIPAKSNGISCWI